jgi:hypothetical protein
LLAFVWFDDSEAFVVRERDDCPSFSHINIF